MAMTSSWRGFLPSPKPLEEKPKTPRFTAVRESLATLREVVLMPRDLAPVLPRAKPGDDVVFLVHGFMASAGVFRPMKRRLEEETHAVVATFTHAPGAGVARIAKSLARLVAKVPHGVRVHLVGHSLGGLVARWYVQELGGHTRVTQTISLASPFHGTRHADRVPVLVGRDLAASSHLLHRLRARAHEFAVPHTSIVADEDLMVVPSESAVFPVGDVVLLPGRGHNTLLYDDESMRHVVDRIRRQ
jgi:pimeloyl-ACP methyl ester carboxylesterase